LTNRRQTNTQRPLYFNPLPPPTSSLPQSHPQIAIMAAVTAQAPVNENTKPTSPVDLSTIPISPAGGDKDVKPNGETGEEQITVFHDKDNFNVKHPLMHKWTLWFTKPPSGKASLRRVTSTGIMLTLPNRVTTGMIC